MSKPKKTCKQCGCLAVQVSGSFLAHYFVDDVCVICREHSSYGMPEWCSERLKVQATAYRAANGSVALPCFAEGCRRPAKAWWYVCSTRCRDKLVRSML